MLLGSHSKLPNLKQSSYLLTKNSFSSQDDVVRNAVVVDLADQELPIHVEAGLFPVTNNRHMSVPVRISLSINN